MSSDAALAAAVALDAGRLLLNLRGRPGVESDGDAGDGGGVPGAPGPDPKALGAMGDARSNDLILGRLRAARPGDALLSEESVDDPARLGAARVWIVDPLDGTREYAMPGRTDWAVHVALWQAGLEIAAAAVALPALGLLFSTDSPPGPPPAAPVRPRIVVSDSRPPGFVGPLAERMGAEVRTLGSAGAKAMAVLRGDADAYVHAGGQWEWDSAAPVGVVLAAGLHASRVDGSPLRYNQARPYLPDLLICRRELAAPLLAALDELIDSSA